MRDLLSAPEPDFQEPAAACSRGTGSCTGDSPKTAACPSGTCRFRLINISPLETHIVQLTAGGAVQEWRALAKDGADLPAHQATPQRARLLLHPGETYDFEVIRPRADSLSLTIDSPATVASRVATRRRSLTAPLPRTVVEIPVIVR